jgi:hypothetical protein
MSGDHCSCGLKFRTGEDFRDHMPCPGTKEEQVSMSNGDDVVASDEALVKMRKAGGTWAAYRNEAMGSAYLGHFQFLKVGDGCTCVVPPEQYPADTVCGMGWRYRLVGFVDLETGKLVEKGRGS